MTASQFRPVDSSHKTQTYSSPQLGVSVYLPPVDSNTTWIVLRLLTRNDNRVFIFHRSQLYRDKYIDLYIHPPSFTDIDTSLRRLKK